MADYLAFIERTGPWDPKAERPVPATAGPGMVRFLKAATCLVIHMTLVKRFSPLALEADSYFELSLWKRYGSCIALAGRPRLRWQHDSALKYTASLLREHVKAIV